MKPKRHQLEFRHRDFMRAAHQGRYALRGVEMSGPVQTSQESKCISEAVLNGSSSSARIWWHGVVSGEITIPSDFNWHLFAYGILQNAFRLEDERVSLEWAELGLAIEEMLAKSPVDYIAHGSEMSAMSLRADLIKRFGNVPGHPILDGAVIFEWFKERLELSLEEVVEECRVWREMAYEERIRTLEDPTSKVWQVTKIKNRIAVIDVLDKSERVRMSSEMKEWLDVRKYFAL